MVASSPALAAARLYGILDLSYVAEDRILTMADEMLAGGVQVLQLRAKIVATAVIAEWAAKLAPRCREYGVPFILNDHPELVVAAGADGIHVGQDDVGMAIAREQAGARALVGKSTHSLAQATAAFAEGADYIGFGPLFATPTKPDYTPIGTHEIREVHRLVGIPIFCIGGIKRDNLSAVIEAGARRVVIVSGILKASDVGGYCRDCRVELARTPLA